MKVSGNNLQNSHFNVPKLQFNGMNTFSNFKPLEKDTVSFSGRRTLHTEDMSIAPTIQACKTVHDSAESAKDYLCNVLNEYLGQYVDKTDTFSSEHFPILDYKTRVKSPHSIREKVISKYSEAHIEMAKSFATMLYAEFSKHYKPTADSNPDKVIKSLQKVFEGHNETGIFLPILEPELSLQTAFSVLKEENAFNFSSVPENKKLKYERVILEHVKNFLNSIEPMVSTVNQEGIKSYVGDLVGAKIVLRDTRPEATKKVIEAIQQAVLDNKFSILSIENYVPDPNRLAAEDSEATYTYISDDTLSALADATGAQLDKKISKSGYMALHLNIDFANSNLDKKNKNGAAPQGEIQIIGAGVAQLKEIEDLCYKLKDNKTSLKPEFKPFKQHFQAYYQGETQELFDDYTYSLYLKQHTSKGSLQGIGFPSLSEMGFKEVIPFQLDFNYLLKLKKQCVSQTYLKDNLSRTDTKKHASIGYNI